MRSGQSLPRYAVYFTPAPGSTLAAFGAAALGYDVATGAAHPFAPPLVLAFPHWKTLVAEPARYGFHATLKAPFELARDATETDLLESARALAGRLHAQGLGPLDIMPMSRLTALVPRVRTAGAACAEAVVRGLDHLRAPLSEADRKRRMLAPLTPRQVAHLDRWGYPYVLDEFRLHMTLAGPLERTTLGEVCDALASLYEPVCEAVELDAISILRQPDRTSRFVAIERIALARPAP